jgi:outer membrane protein
MLKKFLFTLLAYSCHCTAQNVDEQNYSNKLTGDIGVAAYITKSNVKTNSTSTSVLPYAFAEYNRLAMRIDTLGIKTVKMGYGYLELSGRISLDSYKIQSQINHQNISKSTPAPLGLGTFQETPIGAFFINYLHDFNQSKGSLQEIIYFGEVKLGNQVTVYPQIGLERMSKNYSNYYLGVNQTESNITGYNVYSPNTLVNSITGLAIEIPLFDHVYLTGYAKRKWLGDKAGASPIMNRSYQDTFYIGTTYRFD